MNRPLVFDAKITIKDTWINGDIIWVNYIDLTVFPQWEPWFLKGNHPQMALIQLSELL